MCDFYWITVRDLDGNVVAEDQFGPDSDYRVPEEDVCTCGMWTGDTASRRVFLELIEKHLKEMPYGTLTIHRSP